MAFWDRLGRRQAPDGNLPALSREALTAAAEPIDLAKMQASLQDPYAYRQAWQDDVIRYYGSLGVVHFATQFVSTMLSRVIWFAAEVDKTTTEDPKPTKEREVQQLVADFESRKMGRSQNFGRLGGNWFSLGEAHLLGTSEGKEKWPSQWEVLSINELTWRGQRLWRNASPQTIAQPLDRDKTYAVRMWEPDLIYSDLADSSMKAVLDDCERLWTLGRQVTGIARTRLVNRGVLLYANELDTPSRSLTRGGQSAPQSTFADRLVEVARRIIRDPASAAAAIPLPIGMPNALVAGGMNFIDMATSQDQRTMELRNEARESFATGISLPVEVVTGKGGSNHWSGWLVSEDTARALWPIAVSCADAVARAYLHPALKAMGEKDPERFTIWPDLTPIVVHPDRSQAASEGFDRIIISGATWRDAHGFQEDDAPTDDEYEKRVAEKLAPSALPADPAASIKVLQDVGLSDENAQPPAPPTPPSTPPETPPPSTDTTPPATPEDSGTAPENSAPTKKAPPKTAPAGVQAAAVDQRRARFERVARRLSRIETEVRTKLLTAAEEAMTDALRRAGNRVMTAAQRNKSLRDTLQNLPREQVFSALTSGQATSMSLTQTMLLQGAFAEYQAKAAVWMKQAQRDALEEAWDVDDWDNLTDDEQELLLADGDIESEADRHLGLGVGLLMTGLLALATKRLYDPDPQVRELGETAAGRVPVGLIRRALAVAGGATPLDDAAEQLLDETGGVASKLPGQLAELAGLTTGSLVQDGLAETTGVVRDEIRYRWVYGNSVNHFPPHEDLNDYEFSDFNDERLRTDGTDYEWVGGGSGHFFPGDHVNCDCDVVQIASEAVVDVGEEDVA